MLRRSFSLGLLGALVSSPLLAAAAPARRVGRILIDKGERTMQLLATEDGRETVVASYRVAIGPGGPGPKRCEGDMTTPVGRYRVTMRKASQYRTFMLLDYPNAADRRRFAALKASGALPRSATIGGSIGIHGPPVELGVDAQATLMDHDWTAGCVAVAEHAIVEVARLVADGTVVDIEE